VSQTLSYTVARRRRYASQESVAFGAAYLAMLAFGNVALGTYLFRSLWSIPRGQTFELGSLTLVVALIGSTLTVAALGGALAIAALNWRSVHGWALALICLAFSIVPFTVFRLILIYVCWRHSLRVGP
jgi:hypothetical protein